VHVVMNPNAGLMGAAEEAKRMLVDARGQE
jgi:hypothetical protein